MSRRTKATVAEVAGSVGGIQAQVMSAAETSLGIRIEGLHVDDVRRSLWQERTLVKAWTLRGTLHLHPAEDLPMWLAARSLVTPGFNDRTLQAYGITRKQSEALTDAIGAALDGECLSRQELADAAAKKVGKWANESLMSGWGTMLGLATLRGWLCHGLPRGSTVTFVRADQWIDGWTIRD
ncbi:MAG: winged helix DNA-binding domain-containing protein, partial [Actinobacteria bacterium]|nr:winged helix DNA-binding domain-containing protein [Actinomycetota bacterium]